MKILCIDIGGSHLMAGLALVRPESEANIVADSGSGSFVNDGNSRLEWLQKTSNPELPVPATKEQILETIDQVVDELTDQSFERIGVMIPGLADPQRGIWVYAPFSGIRDFPIADILCRKYNSRPVFIENDVNACALAERYFGVCQNCRNFLWITVSNGIGGGLVLNGDIFGGDMGNAGEIGHFCVNENSSYQCGCGNLGCLEIEASGRAIAAKYWDRLSLEKGVGHMTRPSTKQIAEWAREGQPLAQEVFRESGRLIGRAASYAVNLLNLSRVVIGGGVSGAFDVLEPAMNDAFEKMVFRAANPEARIVKTGLGYHAALAGAAAIAWHACRK